MADSKMYHNSTSSRLPVVADSPKHGSTVVTPANVIDRLGAGYKGQHRLSAVSMPHPGK